MVKRKIKRSLIYDLIDPVTEDRMYTGVSDRPKGREDAHKKTHPHLKFKRIRWVNGSGSDEEIRRIKKYNPPLNKTKGGRGDTVGNNIPIYAVQIARKNTAGSYTRVKNRKLEAYRFCSAVEAAKHLNIGYGSLVTKVLKGTFLHTSGWYFFYA